ncbi:MAG: DUF5067 domain-containing protein [Clostridia bacterium]|nr:DUF5067 domain-containing protein [Clostridia bacterium]
MKKIITLILAISIAATFAILAMGSTTEESGTDLGTGEAAEKGSDNNIDQFSVDILSCRLAKDYEGKPIVIVKYSFTNNGEQAQSFSVAFDDAVFQNGIGLNESWVVAEDANYSADNQSKEIQKGATLEVEVAYELNDTTTDINVEISALFSFDESKITKTFPIA